MERHDMDNLQEMIGRAENGDAEAMLLAADDIVWGDMTSSPDPNLIEKAIRYYMKLAQDGNTKAMVELSGMYIEGRGIENNEEKAFAWARKAADLLEPNAYRNIGNFWMFYSERAPDTKKAFDAFTKGALLGDLNSLYGLGDAFRDGECVEKDGIFAYGLYKEAETLLADCADPWFSYYNSDVQLRLGECYLDGIGAAVDITKAIECLQMAVDTYKRVIAEGVDCCENTVQLARAQERLADALRRLDLSEGSK